MIDPAFHHSHRVFSQPGPWSAHVDAVLPDLAAIRAVANQLAFHTTRFTIRPRRTRER
jgi:hypothetical protein